MTARRVTGWVLVLTLSCLSLTATAQAPPQPSDNGRDLHGVPQKSREQLAAILKSLGDAPALTETQNELLKELRKRFPGTSTEQMVERAQEWKKSLSEAAGKNGPTGFEAMGLDGTKKSFSAEDLTGLIGNLEKLQSAFRGSEGQNGPRIPQVGGQEHHRRASSENPFHQKTPEGTPPPIDQIPADPNPAKRQNSRLQSHEFGDAIKSPASIIGDGNPTIKPPLHATQAPTKNRQDVERLMSFWEKNVGPLDRTPALKKAFIDLATAGPTSGNGVIDTPDGKEGFLSFLEGKGTEAGELGKFEFLGKSFEGGSWKFPELGIKNWAPKWSASMPEWSPPNAPSPSIPAGGFDLPTGDGAIPLLVLVAIAAAVYLASRYLPGFVRGESGGAIDLGRKPWPVNPAGVADRAALVKAFEYLSVLLCGDAARVWNHRTIAAALRAKVVGADGVAEELAGLYELARYTPATEPFPESALAAARRCLCHLAGVPAK